MDSLDSLPAAQSQVSAAEAYRAMLLVLEYYFQVDSERAVGSILGDLTTSTWQEGVPTDPAAWDLWLDSIRAVSPNSSSKRTR